MLTTRVMVRPMGFDIKAMGVTGPYKQKRQPRRIPQALALPFLLVAALFAVAWRKLRD